MYPNPLNEILKKRKNIFLCRSILVAHTCTLEVTKSSSLLHDTISVLLLHPTIETRLLKSHLHSSLQVKKLLSSPPSVSIQALLSKSNYGLHVRRVPMSL